MGKGSCSFCGEHFDNVFEVVDHLGDTFDPKFILPHGVKLALADMLYHVYENSAGNKKLQDWAEDTFSFLYIAEKRPEHFYGIVTSPAYSGSYIRQYVYDIVSADSWKKLEKP